MKAIATKTPYRLCLTGGSDLIPYVERHGGDAFSVTIDKFVTVKVSRINTIEIRLSYPQGKEKVKNVRDIKNPIIREALIMCKIKSGLEIISETDIPLGSGLGSSGAFAVGLLNALYALNGLSISPKELAEKAAYLEINRLKYPIGKHDQYLAAYGGFLHLEFKKEGNVAVNQINIPKKSRKKLEKELVLVFSGIQRSTGKIHNVTAKKFKNSKTVFADITNFRNLGNRMRDHIINGELNKFADNLGNLMAAKKKCFVNCSNKNLDKLLNVGFESGAKGAKIVGAGGGGFVYFYVPTDNQLKFKKGISAAGGTVYPFSFVEHGSIVLR